MFGSNILSSSITLKNEDKNHEIVSGCHTLLLQPVPALRLIRHVSPPSENTPWVTKLIINLDANHMYALCDTSVLVYDMKDWDLKLSLPSLCQLRIDHYT